MLISIAEKTKTHYVRRIRNKGSVAVNDGNIYHAGEDTFLRTRIGARTMLSVCSLFVETCQHHTRLLSNKNQLTNQVSDKITHFIGGERSRVDCEVSVIMIQLQVVPHYCAHSVAGGQRKQAKRMKPYSGVSFRKRTNLRGGYSPRAWHPPALSSRKDSHSPTYIDGSQSPNLAAGGASRPLGRTVQ